MDHVPPGIEPMPLTGPTLLSLRPFRDDREKSDATMAAIQGVYLGARPDLWQTYAAGRASVLKAAKPLAELKARFPTSTALIDQAVQRAGPRPTGVVYLPMIARKATTWTVLLDAHDASVLGYLPLDSF